MKKTLNIFLISCIITITFYSSACNFKRDVKFDKEKWVEQIDPLFPPTARSAMLNDLIQNKKLVGLKYDQLVDYLGIPDTKDSSSLSYKIIVDYGHGIDPIYTKDLDFTFSSDSVITQFKVNEWKK